MTAGVHASMMAFQHLCVAQQAGVVERSVLLLVTGIHILRAACLVIFSSTVCKQAIWMLSGTHSARL